MGKIKEEIDMFNNNFRLTEAIKVYGKGTQKDIEKFAKQYNLLGETKEETKNNVKNFIAKIESELDINFLKVVKNEKNAKNAKRKNTSPKNNKRKNIVSKSKCVPEESKYEPKKMLPSRTTKLVVDARKKAEAEKNKGPSLKEAIKCVEEGKKIVEGEER